VRPALLRLAAVGLREAAGQSKTSSGLLFPDSLLRELQQGSVVSAPLHQRVI
jgi:co-chaperonin GroES (HSP10)